MEALKFEYVPAPDGKVGGPMDYRVTGETIDYLTKLMEEGKIIVINGKGEVEIK